jgi:hypothetical protein
VKTEDRVNDALLVATTKGAYLINTVQEWLGNRSPVIKGVESRQLVGTPVTRGIRSLRQPTTPCRSMLQHGVTHTSGTVAVGTVARRGRHP